MIVMTLDVRATHVNKPDCPMRIAPLPDGKGWYCVDCGCHILQKRIEVSNPLGYTQENYFGIADRMGGEIKECRGRPPIKPPDHCMCTHPESNTARVCMRCGKPDVTRSVMNLSNPIKKEQIK